MRLISTLREHIRGIKRQVIVLYYAGRHPDLPMLPRALILITVAYAMSPIDLIPDLIPILGYLDDLVILPLLITLALRSIPKGILDDARDQADSGPVSLPKNWKAGLVIILIWGAVISSLLYQILR